MKNIKKYIGSLIVGALAGAVIGCITDKLGLSSTLVACCAISIGILISHSKKSELKAD